MNENDLSYLIRGAAFKVHTALGPGLLESVYEVALSHELTKKGLDFKNQAGILAVSIFSIYLCGIKMGIL
jgi:GxxExxY protein